MMGVQAASAQLFYDFCLDDHVPSDQCSEASSATWSSMSFASR